MDEAGRNARFPYPRADVRKTSVLMHKNCEEIAMKTMSYMNDLVYHPDFDS